MKRTPMPRRKKPIRQSRARVIESPRRRGAAVLRKSSVRASMGTPSAVTAARPKQDYVRSDALMAAYRLIPCQHCGKSEHGKVCGAHSNWAVHGKGGGVKASDDRAAALCDECHVPILDQGSKLTKKQRQAMWWRAHTRTVMELVARRLWPTDVPVPEILQCPWDLGGVAS